MVYPKGMGKLGLHGGAGFGPKRADKMRRREHLFDRAGGESSIHFASKGPNTMTTPERDDVVERLYDTHVCSPAQNYCRNNALFEEAADEITRLRKELAEAREECDKVAYRTKIDALEDQQSGNEYAEYGVAQAASIVEEIRALTSPASPQSKE